MRRQRPDNPRSTFLLFALGGVFALICFWIGPDLAVVLGIGTVGTLLVVVRRFRPRWINTFWALRIDIGQNSRLS